MTILETPAAQAIALRRAYRAHVYDFWGHHTALGQIVIEDFPDPDDAAAEVTRYHVDAMSDLKARMAALTEVADARPD